MEKIIHFRDALSDMNMIKHKYGRNKSTDTNYHECVSGTIAGFECSEGLLFYITFPDKNNTSHILLRDKESGELYAKIKLKDVLYEYHN